MRDFFLSIDVAIFRELNSLCGWNQTFDRILVLFEMIIKGPIITVMVGMLWFWNDKYMPQRRRTIIIMILAVVVALVANRAISTLLPFRDRPMYSMATNTPSISDWKPDLEHWSSFPSDSASFVFAIATGFCLISWRWGLGMVAFATFVGLARVAVGIHYPSDILVGALLGIAVTLALNRDIVHKRIAGPILSWETRYPPFFYAVFLLVLTELIEGFPVSRRIALAMVHFFAGYTR
jgi:membrane-associated phospholipid phosphatase